MTKTYRPIQEVVDEALAELRKEPEVNEWLEDEYFGKPMTLAELFDYMESGE